MVGIYKLNLYLPNFLLGSVESVWEHSQKSIFKSVLNNKNVKLADIWEVLKEKDKLKITKISDGKGLNWLTELFFTVNVDNVLTPQLYLITIYDKVVFAWLNNVVPLNAQKSQFKATFEIDVFYSKWTVLNGIIERSHFNLPRIGEQKSPYIILSKPYASCQNTRLSLINGYYKWNEYSGTMVRDIECSYNQMPLLDFKLLNSLNNGWQDSGGVLIKTNKKDIRRDLEYYLKLFYDFQVRRKDINNVITEFNYQTSWYNDLYSKLTELSMQEFYMVISDGVEKREYNDWFDENRYVLLVTPSHIIRFVLNIQPQNTLVTNVLRLGIINTPTFYTDDNDNFATWINEAPRQSIRDILTNFANEGLPQEHKKTYSIFSTSVIKEILGGRLNWDLTQLLKNYSKRLNILEYFKNNEDIIQGKLSKLFDNRIISISGDSSGCDIDNNVENTSMFVLGRKGWQFSILSKYLKFDIPYDKLQYHSMDFGFLDLIDKSIFFYRYNIDEDIEGKWEIIDINNNTYTVGTDLQYKSALEDSITNLNNQIQQSNASQSLTTSLLTTGLSIMNADNPIGLVGLGINAFNTISSASRMNQYMALSQKQQSLISEQNANKSITIQGGYGYQTVNDVYLVASKTNYNDIFRYESGDIVEYGYQNNYSLNDIDNLILYVDYNDTLYHKYYVKLNNVSMETEYVDSSILTQQLNSGIWLVMNRCRTVLTGMYDWKNSRHHQFSKSDVLELEQYWQGKS